MRVLIINSMFANRLYRRAADELGALPETELTMLTVDAWRMNGRPMPFEELQAGSPYAAVIGNAGWRGYENRGFYRSGIIRAFRQSNPEVIFLMEEPFSVFAAEVLLIRSLLAPTVPVVFFTWNNLSLTTFDYRPSSFYRNVARWTLPRMDFGLTANTAGIQVLRDSGFRKPVRTIGYGVDSVAYSAPRPGRAREVRVALGIADSDLVIGYVGRLIEMKGVDLLIEAFANLKQEIPDRAMKLLLVGSGEAEQAILRLVAVRGIAADFRHVPSVAHGEVPDYMHALDILVLPSRRKAMWAEQFGRVLVEAMAAGKIVIGSSSGAIPEVIDDAGFVFQENNAEDLAAKIRIAIDLKPEKREQLANRARERATVHYSWHRFALDARDAIEEVFVTHSTVR
ncbi:MAG: glycosyltransferase [Bacteroidota bacterium]|nr:glycosyltransferase [Bacteroidota bacterium]MDP4233946.1 glycosyltransferase [Bacteroidota bacterium]MDP4242803.1 glycosyltransferase [Bacteroidota bacterium]MDP4288517.1 glycosyltransferase [Bacteroidota bacterium]